MANLSISRIARGKLKDSPDNIEKELDNIIKQVESAFNDNAIASTIEKYVSDTSAGSPTTKMTISINKYGKIIKVVYT